MSKRRRQPGLKSWEADTFGFNLTHAANCMCPYCEMRSQQSGDKRPYTRFVLRGSFEAELLVYPPETCGGGAQ